MVFRSPVDRVMPDFLADERGALTQQLDFHRATLLRRLDGLDDVVRTARGAPANLRAILVHMIEETARHNGHADVIRESIDGVTGA